MGVNAEKCVEGPVRHRGQLQYHCFLPGVPGRVA